MLNDGGQGDGGNGDDGSQQHTGIKVFAEDGKRCVLPDDGQTDPAVQDGIGAFLSSLQGGGKAGSGAGVHDHGENVGGQHTQQDGNDLHHSLAPDVADNNHQDGNQGDPPVVLAVIDGGAGQGQTDADDDGTGNDGGEVAHDLLGAEDLKEQSQQQVDKTGHGHAKAGVGQRDFLTGGSHEAISTQESEGRTEESGNLPAGDQVEQQSAETGEQQGGGNIQAGDGGNENGCAEHGEQVLHAEQELLGAAQSAGVVHGFIDIFGICHK